jgi:hypothetical protein
VTGPIRLFVGTSPNGEDYEAEAVLLHSVLSQCSLPVDVTWMRQAATGPYSGWKNDSARTPFSHFRWSPPALCDFSGRAIYCDVDFIVRADLAELWTQDIPGVLLARTSKKPGGKVKTCCMLFDCAKANGHIPTLAELRQMPDPQGHLSKRVQVDGLAAPYVGDWNCIDVAGYEDIHDPRIKAIHYSRMEHQPHLPYALARLKAAGRSHWYTGDVFTHPRADLVALFATLLAEAQAAGHTYESFGYGAAVPIARKNFTYSVHRGAGAITR